MRLATILILILIAMPGTAYPSGSIGIVKSTGNGTLLPKAVLQFLFDNYDSKNQLSRYVDMQPAFPSSGIEGWSGKVGHARLIMLRPFTENGHHKYVAVISLNQTKDDEELRSHADKVGVGIFIFSENNSNWALEKFNPVVTLAGSFGNAPTGKLIQLGKNKYGILFEDTYRGMGDVVHYASIANISTAVPIIILNPIILAEDDTGNCPSILECYKYDSEMDFIQASTGAEYDDIVLTSTGKKLDKSGKHMISTRKITRFAFLCGMYVKELWPPTSGKAKTVTPCKTNNPPIRMSWNARLHQGNIERYKN